MSETPAEQISNIITMLSRNKKGDRDAAIFYLERLKKKLESGDGDQKPTSYEIEKKRAPYPLTKKCHSCTRTRDYCYEHGIDFPDCYRPEEELSHLIPVPEMPGFVLNQRTCAMEPDPRVRAELVTPEFKVGDHVMTTGNSVHCSEDLEDIGKGMEGVITHIDCQSVCVKFDVPVPNYNYESLWFRKKDCIHKEIEEK